MLSIRFQRLKYMHIAGLKISQQLCFHWNLIILNLLAVKLSTWLYDYFWNGWKPPDARPTVVVTGPSCCHLSVVGKRLRQWDPCLSQGLDTAKLAVCFIATILVIENVAQLLDAGP